MNQVIKSVLIIFILLTTLTAVEARGPMQERKERIEKIFNELRADNLEILDSFYHKDIRFYDPIGELKGLDKMKAYYAGMYENVKEIKFEFDEHMIQGDTFSSFWTMTFTADGLKGGEPISIEGLSHIKFDSESNLVIYHRDYFDMGAMVYEHIPVVGGMIRYIKGRFKHE